MIQVQQLTAGWVIYSTDYSGAAADHRVVVYSTDDSGTAADHWVVVYSTDDSGTPADHRVVVYSTDDPDKHDRLQDCSPKRK
jgi:hypothetical protein